LRSNSSVWVFDATNLSFLREDHFDNPMQYVPLRLNPGLGIDLKRAPAVTAAAVSCRNKAQSRLIATRNELAQAHALKGKVTGERRALEQELALSVVSSTSAIAEGVWGQVLISYAAKIKELEIEMDSARQRRDGKSGLWGTIRAYGEYTAVALNLNGQLSSAKDALVEQVKRSWPPGGSSFPVNTASLLRAMEEKTSEILVAETDTNRLANQEREYSKQYDQASTELRAAENEQTMSEQRYYGLGAV
jgi:hypothetical protein